MIKQAVSGARLALALIALIALAPTAGADTTITWTGNGSEPGQSMEIRDGVVRAAGDANSYVLFDTRQGQFTVINTAERTYLVMTQQDIDRMLGAQQRLMEQVEQQLAAMPAAQREQMREMLKQRMPPGMGEAPPPRRVDATGETRQIAGVDCEVNRVYRGSEQVAELCMADYRDLNIDSGDYDALRAMHEFATKMAERAGAMGAGASIDFGDMTNGAFPVAFQGFGALAVGGAQQLDSVSAADLDPQRFAVPAGFRQQSIPDMPF